MCKMNKKDGELSLDLYKSSNFTGGCLEIRLFYVRIAPCLVEGFPDHLTLRHLRREIGISLDINGSRVPSSESATISLRCDRANRDSNEVTYVSTDNMRVSGAIEFEVMEGKMLVLCGSLERVDVTWSNGNTGWDMDCYLGGKIANGGKGGGGMGLFQKKFGYSSPTIEVYIAGCCSGVPVILTKVIQVSPRRKVPRQCVLDAIPEDEEVGKVRKELSEMNGLARQRKLQIADVDGNANVDGDADEFERKIDYNYYQDEMYVNEDGEMSYFNAGVRVGVGIGLGMCLGVGIGVGLLMRSYQATTSRFRRRFF